MRISELITKEDLLTDKDDRFKHMVDRISDKAGKELSQPRSKIVCKPVRRTDNTRKRKGRFLEGLERQISQQDVDQLDRFADKVFARVGIDVKFTRNFLQRVNDDRNGKQITMSELTKLFKQEANKHGKPIARLGPDTEAVLSDMQTDINAPFVLQYDRENDELDLVVKTIIRNPDFETSDQVFAVERKLSKSEKESATNMAKKK